MTEETADGFQVYIWLQSQRSSQRCDMHFAFHGVFGEETQTGGIYQRAVYPLVGSVVAGFNATCFAYGMTGSGKTHTMFGEMYFTHVQEPGIVPLALSDLFAYARMKPGACFIKISYLEIYNEQVRDLLTSKACTRSQGLMLVEDPQKGVITTELSEYSVESAQEVTELVREGNERRTMAATGANQFSTRSHAVLQFAVEVRTQDKEGGQSAAYSKLSLIDLAGSERAAVTENRGARLLEGANINRSLLALGNCINILSNPEKAGKFVPYRDSKLTRLLKDALGGRTKSVMIACVSPATSAFEETLHTLKYAERARRIKVSAARNVKEVQVHVSEYKAIIAALKTEVETLKKQITVHEDPTVLTSQSQSPADSFALGQELTRNFEDYLELKQSIQEVELLNHENKKQVKALIAELEYVETLNDAREESRIKVEIKRIHENVKENEEEHKALLLSLQNNMRAKGKLQRQISTLQDDKQRDVIQLEIAERTLKMEKMDLYIQNQEMKQKVVDSQKQSEEKEKTIISLRLEIEDMKKQLAMMSRGMSESETRSDGLSPHDGDLSSVHLHNSRQSSTSFTLYSPPDVGSSSDSRSKPLVISDLNRARALRKCETMRSPIRSESAEGFLSTFAGSGSRGDETTVLRNVKEQLMDEETDQIVVPGKPSVKVSTVIVMTKRENPPKKPESKKPVKKSVEMTRVRSSSNTRERKVSVLGSKGRSQNSSTRKADPQRLTVKPASISNLLSNFHKKILNVEEANALTKAGRQKETPMIVISLRGSKTNVKR